MRINVYAEELTDETELVVKEANGRTFYGIRLFLKSPVDLHHTEYDDDRSAITLWVPWTKAHGHDFQLVGGILQQLAQRLVDAQEWNRV